MELLILDKKFNELGTIDLFSSLQWIRRYYDVGNFQLNVTADYFELLDSGYYLYRKDVTELALIESVLFTTDLMNKRVVECRGRFIEAILDYRVFEREVNYSGNHEEIAKQIVSNYFINPTNNARKISNLLFGRTYGLGSSITLQAQGEIVLDKLFDMLREKELSQRIIYNYLTNSFSYEVWQGLDRTEEQSVNSWAVFSDNFENIQEFSYQNDTSDFANFAYVAGDGEGAEQVIVEVNQVVAGQERREVYIHASTSRKNDDGTEMTEAEYLNKLWQKGIEELEKYKVVEAFDGAVNNNANLLYRVDYDLGDLCTCINSQIGKMANKRITEIKEIYEDGNVEIFPKFGDDYITITAAIKREVSK